MLFLLLRQAELFLLLDKQYDSLQNSFEKSSGAPLNQQLCFCHLVWNICLIFAFAASITLIVPLDFIPIISI